MSSLVSRPKEELPARSTTQTNLWCQYDGYYAQTRVTMETGDYDSVPLVYHLNLNGWHPGVDSTEQ